MGKAQTQEHDAVSDKIAKILEQKALSATIVDLARVYANNSDYMAAGAMRALIAVRDAACALDPLIASAREASDAFHDAIRGVVEAKNEAEREQAALQVEPLWIELARLDESIEVGTNAVDSALRHARALLNSADANRAEVGRCGNRLLCRAHLAREAAIELTNGGVFISEGGDDVEREEQATEASVSGAGL